MCIHVNSQKILFVTYMWSIQTLQTHLHPCNGICSNLVSIQLMLTNRIIKRFCIYPAKVFELWDSIQRLILVGLSWSLVHPWFTSWPSHLPSPGCSICKYDNGSFLKILINRKHKMVSLFIYFLSFFLFSFWFVCVCVFRGWGGGFEVEGVGVKCYYLRLA